MSRSPAAQRPLEILQRPEGGAGETRPLVVSPADPAQASRQVVTTLHQLIDTLTELANERPSSESLANDRDLPLLLNAVETGRLLSVSRSKVLDLAARGEIPSVRVGGSVRIPRNALTSWISEQTIQKEARSRPVAAWAQIDRGVGR